MRATELAIDQERDPTVRRVSKKDTFASIIDLHIDDLTSYGKPIRRSKDAVLRRLRADLGDLPVAHLTRERIVQSAGDRAKAGAGPATLAVDLSFVGTVQPSRRRARDARRYGSRAPCAGCALKDRPRGQCEGEGPPPYPG